MIPCHGRPVQAGGLQSDVGGADSKRSEMGTVQFMQERHSDNQEKRTMGVRHWECLLFINKTIPLWDTTSE